MQHLLALPSDEFCTTLPVDGATNSFSASAGWTTESVDFTATTNNTAVQLIGGGASAVRVDRVELLAQADDPTLYYLPEEPLTPLRGQDAYGDWNLEVWDTRTGALRRECVPLP